LVVGVPQRLAVSPVSLARISTRRVEITRNDDGGVNIYQIGRLQKSLNLDGDEWLDLIGLVLAVKAAADFRDEYADR
jgi:hypothetical protein